MRIGKESGDKVVASIKRHGRIVNMKMLAQMKSDIPEYAHLLKAARSNKKLRLEDVAKKVGVSAMAVSYWEKGQRVPRLDTFERWMDVLGFKLVVDFKSPVASQKIDK